LMWIIFKQKDLNLYIFLLYTNWCECFNSVHRILSNLIFKF